MVSLYQQSTLLANHCPCVIGSHPRVAGRRLVTVGWISFVQSYAPCVATKPSKKSLQIQETPKPSMIQKYGHSMFVLCLGALPERVFPF